MRRGRFLATNLSSAPILGNPSASFDSHMYVIDMSSITLLKAVEIVNALSSIGTGSGANSISGFGADLGASLGYFWGRIQQAIGPNSSAGSSV